MPGLVANLDRSAHALSRAADASDIATLAQRARVAIGRMMKVNFPCGAPDRMRRVICQPACKPGSVWSCLRDGHSSGTPIAGRLEQPTRAAGLKADLRLRLPGPQATPIWSCSGWGLPCRCCCQKRGALLPHRFTLTAFGRSLPRRSVFCGTFPGVAPGGR
jgi:hypothetical protein